MATISPLSGGFTPFATSGSGGSTFLTATSESPVQRMLREQAEQSAKTAGNSYFESEDFLRMKAFEIRRRIVMYQNLGLSQEYQAAQAEGAEVVKKYQALLAKAKQGGNTNTTA